MGRVVDLTGRRFGHLLAVKYLGARCGRSRWLLTCDCGSDHEVSARDLLGGVSKSCGCEKANMISARRKRHGLTKSRSHKAWARMKNRCYNPNSLDYARYGGRGIKVCDRWLSCYENFLEDMGEPAIGLSLDRIDVNLGYEPSNCRWATHTEQAQNKRDTVWVEHEGKKICLSEYARIMNVNCVSLRDRIGRSSLSINEIAKIMQHKKFEPSADYRQSSRDHKLSMRSI